MEVDEETFFDQQELLIHDKQNDHEKIKCRRKRLKTVTLSMAFFCLGLCIAIPGPTLLDLGRRVNRDTEHMTFIFTARSVGFLIGSLVGGVLFDFFDQQILLFYTLALVAVATAGVPWCSALLTLSVLICMQGVAFGVLDTGGNVFCIKIWGKKSAPFMQILHFAFGVGAFLAPLIARPFLINTDISDNSTKGGYHSLNFRVMPLTSLAASNRLVRDASSHHFLYKGYVPKQDALHSGIFKDGDILVNDTGQNQISTIMSSWHINNLYAGKTYNDYADRLNNLRIFKKWQHLVESRIVRSVNLENATQLSDEETEQNVTTSVLIPSTSPKRAKKPDHNSDSALNKDFADASLIDSKLKDIKKNHPENIEVKVKTTTSVVTSTGHDLNVTSENVTYENLTSENVKNQNENVTNNAQDWNNSEHFSVSGTPSAISIITTSTTTSSITVPVTITTSPITVPDTTSTTSPITVPVSTSTTSPITVPVATSTTSPITVPVTTSTSPIIVPVTTLTAATLTTSPAVTSTSTTSTAAEASASIEDSDIATTNSITNRSSIMKPKTTGDLLRDMVATLVGMSRIQFAYAVIGLLLAINAGLFLYLHCKDRSLKSQPYVRRYRDPARNPYTKCFVGSIIILLFLFFLAYMGIEVTFGGLLATFVTDYPVDPWTPAQAATLTSIFWGCLALGRGIAIFIARCVKPSSMMVLNLCLTVIGAVILSIGVPVHPVLLWVGTVIVGLGMSSLFPTAISWANSHYPLSGRATAVFVTGCGVGEMSVPVLTGHLYETVSHMALMYVTLFLSCLLSVLYLSVQLLVCRKGNSIQRSHPGSVHLKNMEDVDESDVGIVEGISLGIMETTWRRRVQVEEERKNESGEGNTITEFTKLMEM